MTTFNLFSSSTPQKTLSLALPLPIPYSTFRILCNLFFIIVSLPHCPRGNRLFLLVLHSTLSAIPPPEKQNI